MAVNRTSLSETLLESELFGHVRGAFTGAVERRAGLVLEANRGTIFLDEVGDMSLTMQSKLLRRFAALSQRRLQGSSPAAMNALVSYRGAGGNKSRAAKLLGVPRRTLYRMLERFEVEPMNGVKLAH